MGKAACPYALTEAAMKAAAQPASRLLRAAARRAALFAALRLFALKNRPPPG